MPEGPQDSHGQNDPRILEGGAPLWLRWTMSLRDVRSGVSGRRGADYPEKLCGSVLRLEETLDGRFRPAQPHSD